MALASSSSSDRPPPAWPEDTGNMFEGSGLGWGLCYRQYRQGRLEVRTVGDEVVAAGCGVPPQGWHRRCPQVLGLISLRVDPTRFSEIVWRTILWIISRTALYDAWLHKFVNLLSSVCDVFWDSRYSIKNL